MSLANLLLGGESGLAFVADDMSAIVKGHSIPFDGNANNLFTYTSPSTKYIFNSAGILVPGTTLRCDYDPVTLLPKGLLIEEQRTNLFLRSAEAGNASWSKNQATITDNSLTAPDGTSEADVFTDSNGGTFAELTQSVSVTSGNTYCYSRWFKQGTRRYAYMSMATTRFPDNAEAYFDLQTGVVKSAGAGLVTSGIIAYPNGWYRCYIVATCDSTGSNIFYAYHTNTAGTSVLYTGDGTGTLGIWGAVLEAGAFPSSYIPTAGSTVTRAADNITLATSAFPYLQTAWTMDAWADAVAVSDRITWALDANNPGRRVNAFRSGGGISTCFMDAGADGGGTALLDNQSVAGAAFKAAQAFATNDAAGATNGGTVATDGSIVSSAFNRLTLGASYAQLAHLNGHLRRLRFVPRRRPNAELQAITA